MNEEKYWNEFYKRQGIKPKKSFPSQFATFVLNEIDENTNTIIDIGCGNGRDTFFFADYDLWAIGIDRSKSAVHTCQEKSYANADFINASIDDVNLLDPILSLLDKNSCVKGKVLYSRFFLHAINEQEQKTLIEFASSLLQKGERFFLEFRTNRDKFQEKVTDHHYRRFIDPLDFSQDVVKAGFRIIYFVEGFGYAKYKNDDAHVARFIIEKT